VTGSPCPVFLPRFPILTAVGADYVGCPLLIFLLSFYEVSSHDFFVSHVPPALNLLFSFLPRAGRLPGRLIVTKEFLSRSHALTPFVSPFFLFTEPSPAGSQHPSKASFPFFPLRTPCSPKFNNCPGRLAIGPLFF